MIKSAFKRDTIGAVRLLARAENYVMVRRPGAFPFVLPEAKWDAMPYLSVSALPDPEPK